MGLQVNIRTPFRVALENSFRKLAHFLETENKLYEPTSYPDGRKFLELSAAVLI
ncbi:hypothetical protein J2W97_000428 [Paenibacillus jamilae]|uniref:Uncharacterized protein n=1 Tax=Paenibacillus polymyxa TaxID=1406 RepID=A0A378Y341_PAEPO|nr:hypothetical protein [Paenibacillus jamilae]SPY13155.1 Uncharacterised protein [Paenibacillus polymyxa]SUA70961.1 Uncharacterised protein [Paenibacillus polymyxa]